MVQVIKLFNNNDLLNNVLLGDKIKEFIKIIPEINAHFELLILILLFNKSVQVINVCFSIVNIIII